MGLRRTEQIHGADDVIPRVWLNSNKGAKCDVASSPNPFRTSFAFYFHDQGAGLTSRDSSRFGRFSLVQNGLWSRVTWGGRLDDLSSFKSFDESHPTANDQPGRCSRKRICNKRHLDPSRSDLDNLSS
jgi:hypothetical protein